MKRTQCKPCACRRAAFNVVIPDVNPASLVLSLISAFKGCPCNCDTNKS